MPGTSRRSQPSAGGGGWRTRSVMRTLRSLPASHVSTNTFESISVLPSGSVKGILASPSESTAPLPADAAFTTTSTLLPAGALRRYTVCAEPIPVVATITAAVIATSRHRFAIRSPLAQPIISVRLTFPRRVRIYPRAMLKDLRYALHIIAKDRWYSAVAVVALSLGIGLNATVFTLVNAILIRGLPYKDSAQLYMLSSKRQDAGQSNVSKLDLDDWRSEAKTFEALGAFNGNSVNVSDDRSAPENVRSAAITSNAFSLIAQQPVLGRDLLPGDEQTGAEPVVLLGYKLWKRRFAEDRGILGKTLRIDGKPATIVGVMPDGLDFPNSTELWVPLIPDEGQQKRDARFIAVFGRMRKDVSREQAQTEMNGIAQRLATAFPDTNKDYPQVSVQTFNERFNGGNIRTGGDATRGGGGVVLPTLRATR